MFFQSLVNGSNPSIFLIFRSNNLDDWWNSSSFLKLFSNTFLHFSIFFLKSSSDSSLNARRNKEEEEEERKEGKKRGQNIIIYLLQYRLHRYKRALKKFVFLI